MQANLINKYTKNVRLQCAVTRVWVEKTRNGISIPGRKRDYYILQNGQTNSEAHPVSHLMGTYCFFPKW